MRYLLATLLAMLVLSGCSAMDAEDKAFYYDGWMQPEKGANKRLDLR